MATICHNRGLKLFKYRPKYHLGIHLAFDMGCDIALNPACSSALCAFAVLCAGMATWSDEDYIGRVSRTSRSCHQLSHSVRTLQKSLGQYRTQFHTLK